MSANQSECQNEVLVNKCPYCGIEYERGTSHRCPVGSADYNA